MLLCYALTLSNKRLVPALEFPPGLSPRYLKDESSMKAILNPAPELTYNLFS